MSIAAFDVDGTIIPGAELDEMYELGFDDEAFGDPSGWPSWTDEALWETGVDPLPEEPYEPSPEDWESWGSYCREVEQRLLEARLASDFDDEQERRYRYTDSDAASAGLAVG